MAVIDRAVLRLGGVPRGIVAVAVACAILLVIAGAPRRATGTVLDKDPQADGFPGFAANTLVCVGEAAPAEVREAAERLAAKLRSAGGPADNLRTAEAVNNDPLAAGRHHLIAVGTWEDNVIARKCWGHWSFTEGQRQVHERDQARSREGHPPDLLTLPPPSERADWRWRGKLNVFGFGQFDGSIGYIEPGRNFYALQLIPNELGPKPEELGKVDQLFVIKVTGTDAAGVVRAAAALEATGLLHGVVTPEGAAAELPKRWTPKELGAEQLSTTAPPDWSPTMNLIGGEGQPVARYLGWVQGHSLQYAGFAEASGVEPVRIWRLKYATPAGFKDYMSFLTPRASGNELLIAEVADAASAARAVEALTTDRVGKDWQAYEAGPWKGRRSAEGHTFIHLGRFVVGESLPPDRDEAVLGAMKAAN